MSDISSVSLLSLHNPPFTRGPTLNSLVGVGGTKLMRAAMGLPAVPQLDLSFLSRGVQVRFNPLLSPSPFLPCNIPVFAISGAVIFFCKDVLFILLFVFSSILWHEVREASGGEIQGDS